MNLGDAVLTITVDDTGLVSGFDKAKDKTDDFVDDTKEQAGAVDGSWALSFAAVAAGAAVAIAAFNKIIVVANEMLDAFAEQERATTTLTLALSTNKNVTDDTALALHNWAGEMQKSTIFGDEVIEQNLAMIAAMGMSEERIKEVMEAAMTLSSVYNIDLEQSVRGLALSLEAGTTGMLSRYVPALRTFTKEQLEAGAAINWTAEQFPHGAQIIGDTISGLQIRMANLVSDQKEKIGSALADSYRGVEGFMGMIETIGDVAAIVVGVFVKSLITLAEWFRWQYDVFIGFFKLLFQLIADVALVIWQPLQYGFQVVVQAIKIGFVTALNWILDQAEFILQKIGEGLSNISGGLLGKNLISVDLGQLELVTEKIKPITEAISKIFSDATNQVIDFGAVGVRGFTNMVNIWTDKGTSVEQSIKKVQASVGGLSDTISLSVEETAEATRQLDMYTESLKETAKQSDQAYSAIELNALMMVQSAQKIGASAEEPWRTGNLAVSDYATELELAMLKCKLVVDAAQKETKETLEVSWHSIARTVSQVLGQLGGISSTYFRGQLTALDADYKKRKKYIEDNVTDEKDKKDQLTALDEEYASDQAEIKKKEWESNKALSVANVIMSTIEAVVRTLAAYPWPWNLAPAAIMGALGAVQLGMLVGQPEPAFAQGGEFTVPPGYPDDSFPMRVQSGEQVKVTPAGEAAESVIHNTMILDGRVLADWYTRASRNRRTFTYQGAVVA